MKKVVMICIALIAGYLEANVVNPYKNLDKQDKLNILTTYFVEKELKEIKKKYPSEPKKPIIKKADSLVKGRFEKTSQFQKRVKTVKQKREAYITTVENEYKKKVLEYNRKTQELTDLYNKKVAYLKNNSEKVTAEAMSKAYDVVYGMPQLTAIDYDADNELFYAELTSSKGNFSKKVAIKVPLSIAEQFYDAPKKTKVIYEYSNGKIYLKDIKVTVLAWLLTPVT